MIRLAPVLLAAFAFTGCGGGSSSPPPPANAGGAGGGGGACGVGFQGPLIGYSYQPPPPPAAQGGALVDGTYDLVQIVKHTNTPGQWSSNNAPAFRWVMRFTTRERSPNHTSGDVAGGVEIPPSVQCNSVRFATFGTELRNEGGDKGIESHLY